MTAGECLLLQATRWTCMLPSGRLLFSVHNMRCLRRIRPCRAVVTNALLRMIRTAPSSPCSASTLQISFTGAKQRWSSRSHQMAVALCR